MELRYILAIQQAKVNERLVLLADRKRVNLELTFIFVDKGG